MADRRRRVHAKRTWPRRCRGTHPSAARTAVNKHSKPLSARGISAAPQPMEHRSALRLRLPAYCGYAARSMKVRRACQRPVVAVEVRRHVWEPPRHLQRQRRGGGVHGANGLFVCLFDCLCVCLFVCLCVCLYDCVFVRLFLFCMFVCLFVCCIPCLTCGAKSRSFGGGAVVTRLPQMPRIPSRHVITGAVHAATVAGHRTQKAAWHTEPSRRSPPRFQESFGWKCRRTRTWRRTR